VRQLLITSTTKQSIPIITDRTIGGRGVLGDGFQVLKGFGSLVVEERLLDFVQLERLQSLGLIKFCEHTNLPELTYWAEFPCRWDNAFLVWD